MELNSTYFYKNVELNSSYLEEFVELGQKIDGEEESEGLIGKRDSEIL